jgi:hypothetical protein
MNDGDPIPVGIEVRENDVMGAISFSGTGRRGMTSPKNGRSELAIPQTFLVNAFVEESTDLRGRGLTESGVLP